MMIRCLAAAAVTAALCLAGTAAAQEAEAPEIWETMSVAQARALAADIDVVVESVAEEHEVNFVMFLTRPDGLFFELHGMDCTGVGEARSCPLFTLAAYFPVEDAADAAAMAQRVDVAWLNEAVRDDALAVARLVALYGGVTPEHMRRMLLGFIETISIAYAQAFPEDDAGA